MCEARVVELTNDKKKLEGEVYDLKLENKKLREKLDMKKKVICQKTAQTSILAGKIHQIKQALPLNARIQLGHKLKTEISKEEIESTLNVMGMTKGDDLDDIELVV